MSFYAVDFPMSLVGVENSLMSDSYFYIFWLLGLPARVLPSTVILIYPYSFISALTSVLMERLLRLSTSLLYFANLYQLLRN
jgi:hypothetical protein